VRGLANNKQIARFADVKQTYPFVKKHHTDATGEPQQATEEPKHPLGR